MPPTPVSKIPFLLDGFLKEKFPTYRISWQGIKFKPPCKKLWLRPVCKLGDNVDMEKGLDGYSQRVGLYLIDIFAPGPLMPADAWEVAELIENAFRREEIEGIQIEDPHSENVGIDNSNDTSRVRVTVPWWCWAGKHTPNN